MASRKHLRIGAQFPCGGDILEGFLNDPRYSVAQVAALIGTSPQHLANLLAEPAPVALLPRNWSATNGAQPPFITAGNSPWFGLAPIPYAGPQGGYTWGPPAHSRADGT